MWRIPKVYVEIVVSMATFPHMGMLLWKHTEYTIQEVHIHPIFNSVWSLLEDIEAFMGSCMEY